MSYMDMYGRSCDQAATFDYPSTQLPLKRAGKLYVELPAAANRIFGVPQSRNRNADQTVVQLDPTSTYEYRSYNPSDDTPPAIGLGGFGRKKRRLGGLGGLGEELTHEQVMERKKQDMKAWREMHPNLNTGFASLAAMMDESPMITGLVTIIGGAFMIALVKALPFGK